MTPSVQAADKTMARMRDMAQHIALAWTECHESGKAAAASW